jgi:hypothetical protein
VVFACTHTPQACVGAGAFGPLEAVYVSTPDFTVGEVCVHSFFHHCGVLDSILAIEPGAVGVAAYSHLLHTGVGGGVLATRTLTLTVLGVGLFGSSYTVGVGAGGGVTGVIVLTPHVHRCLLIVGTTITAPPC